jgi:spermidine synthase
MELSTVEQHEYPSRKKAFQLFLLGFLSLLLELILIRYLAGNVWNLSYFPNLVLLAAFVGLGCGFIFHHKLSDVHSEALGHLCAILLMVLVGFVLVFHPTLPGFSSWAGELDGELYFTETPEPEDGSHLWTFIFWFGSVVLIFACIAQRTAKLFAKFAPLHAYTLDIAGSCAGILVFMGLSWLEAPAFTWFLVLIPLYLLAMDLRGRWRIAPIVPLFALVVLAQFQDADLLADPSYKGELEVRWSPYQKIEYAKGGTESHRIYVNGVPHQRMFSQADLEGSIYEAPYKLRQAESDKAPYKRVLIIGAGSGNDVMAALMHGVEHIDAVEIDPVIADIGRQHHPSSPYSDERVHVHTEDGRAFLARQGETYDLILFALTDSLVKVSAMAQLRLENYLFTVESVRSAYQRLSKDGVLLFYNFYRRPWLMTKIETMITQATGRPPVKAFQRGSFAIITVEAGEKNANKPPEVAASVDVPTDDWPFLYLEHRIIPTIYLKAMGGMLALILLLLFLLQGVSSAAHPKSGGLGIKLAFLFMGVAFMLLETKSIIQFSLLFGTSWLNASLVFLAVLLSVLAANWAATIVPRSWLHTVFVVLLLSCLLPFAFPLSGLLELESALLRFVVASLITFCPIFFANLVFSILFRQQAAPEHVFGWNIIGATLGGVIEYASMNTGYAALALVVLGSYSIVFLLVLFQRRSDLPLAMPHAAP